MDFEEAKLILEQVKLGGQPPDFRQLQALKSVVAKENVEERTLGLIIDSGVVQSTIQRLTPQLGGRHHEDEEDIRMVGVTFLLNVFSTTEHAERLIVLSASVVQMSGRLLACATGETELVLVICWMLFNLCYNPPHSTRRPLVAEYFLRHQLVKTLIDVWPRLESAECPQQELKKFFNLLGAHYESDSDIIAQCVRDDPADQYGLLLEFLVDLSRRCKEAYRTDARHLTFIRFCFTTLNQMAGHQRMREEKYSRITERFPNLDDLLLMADDPTNSITVQQVITNFKEINSKQHHGNPASSSSFSSALLLPLPFSLKALWSTVIHHNAAESVISVASFDLIVSLGHRTDSRLTILKFVGQWPSFLADLIAFAVRRKRNDGLFAFLHSLLLGTAFPLEEVVEFDLVEIIVASGAVRHAHELLRLFDLESFDHQSLTLVHDIAQFWCQLQLLHPNTGLLLRHYDQEFPAILRCAQGGLICFQPVMAMMMTDQ